MTQLNHAALAVVRGDLEGAAELLGRVQATLDRAGIVLDPDDASRSTGYATSSGRKLARNPCVEDTN
jgi:hypothetical protein